MYVRCDESSLCSRIAYVHSPENFSAGVWNVKTMHTGFNAYTYCVLRPGADTEETGRYDLAWKDLCSVLNALE